MAADRYAIAAGIWWIRPDATTGVHLAGLPLEEGAFFLATNLLIGFGMTLALDPRARTRLDSLGRRARRLGRRLRARPAAAGVRWWHAVLLAWVLVMVPTPLAPRAFAGLAYLSTGLLALGVLGLALERMGRAALLACGLALLFGFGVEWLGSRSGVPFGAYRYTAPGPLLAGVPLLVPVGWWAFTALAVAVVPRRHRWWAAPLALVAWDLGLDPLMVRQGFWRFDHPGGYYGVPWSNFLGWAASGAVLVALLSVLVPRIERLSGRAARTVYGAQAGFMVIGLTLFGMPWAALAAFAAMGAVMLAWRPVRAAVQRAGSR
jgi:putative membrane protein